MKFYYILVAIILFGCSTERKADQSKNNVLERITPGTESKVVCSNCIESEFADQEPDTVFQFSNGHKLILCGYVEQVKEKRVFSEFVLYECGKDSIVDFWGAVENYEVTFLNDTLRLKKLEMMALGENRRLINEIWFTENFYYKAGSLIRSLKFNPNVKYNATQIKQTLLEFETTKWKAQNSGITEAYSEEKMELANRLMISAISGNAIAEEYLKVFKVRFQPDGAYAEWYSEMIAMLDLYKARNQTK